MEAPLLSIVIANYNYGRFLEDAIKSVLNQCCHNVELIIIDGGSTDNSIEVIKKYANGLPPKTYRPNWRVNVQQRSLEDFLLGVRKGQGAVPCVQQGLCCC